MTKEEKETLKLLQEKAQKEEVATKKKIKKGRFMKGIIITVMLFLFLFSLTCLYITYKTNTEPSTLIVSVFAFCGFECGILGRIKTTKQKSNKEQREDDAVC
ncbi:MAG: hypothetical protein E7211_20630 [Clostridium lundense]|nr:hypothetical protein [Clostridium lundense]